MPLDGFLFPQGVNLDLVAKNGITPLQVAVQIAVLNNNLPIVKLLVLKNGITPLQVAVQIAVLKNNLPIVKFLVSKEGGKLNPAGAEGSTLLKAARSSGYHAIAEFLISQGAKEAPTKNQ